MKTHPVLFVTLLYIVINTLVLGFLIKNKYLVLPIRDVEYTKISDDAADLINECQKKFPPCSPAYEFEQCTAKMFLNWKFNEKCTRKAVL